MFLERILPGGGLAALDLGGFDGLGLSAGPTRFTTPGPARPVAITRTKYLSQAEHDAKLRRHQQRAREQEVHDRKQREEDLGRTRRDR